MKDYCHDDHIVQKTNTLHYVIKIKTDLWYHGVKMDMMNWLHMNKVFINKTKLTTAKNCVLGWFIGTHPKHTHRVSSEQ